jgi:hypothetical protein
VTTATTDLASGSRRENEAILVSADYYSLRKLMCESGLCRPTAELKLVYAATALDQPDPSMALRDKCAIKYSHPLQIRPRRPYVDRRHRQKTSWGTRPCRSIIWSSIAISCRKMTYKEEAMRDKGYGGLWLNEGLLRNLMEIRNNRGPSVKSPASLCAIYYIIHPY